jgi:hypothetical protein
LVSVFAVFLQQLGDVFSFVLVHLDTNSLARLSYIMLSTKILTAQNMNQKRSQSRFRSEIFKEKGKSPLSGSQVCSVDAQTFS